VLLERRIVGVEYVRQRLEEAAVLAARRATRLVEQRQQQQERVDGRREEQASLLDALLQAAEQPRRRVAAVAHSVRVHLDQLRAAPAEHNGRGRARVLCREEAEVGADFARSDDQALLRHLGWRSSGGAEALALATAQGGSRGGSL